MANTTVVETLKRILKSKKVTYGTLAHEIGMSESGIKKLFTAKDISLRRLSQIAEVIGISLGDLFRLAEENQIRTVRFKPKQEAFLHENPTIFRVFWLLTVEGKSIDSIRRSEKLTQNQIHRYLLKLENLDLLKLGKKDRVISVHRGLIRWISEGPLLKKLNEEWSILTLKKALREKKGMHRLAYFSLNEKSKEAFLQKLNDVFDEFARRSQREKAELSERDLIPVTSLTAVSLSGFLTS